MTVHSQSFGGEGKSKDLQGNKEEISYQGSIRGKTKPSLGSAASPKMEGGTTGTSTTASMDTVDLAARVFGCSPVVSGGVEPAEGVAEEEAIGENESKKRKRKEERREIGEVGKFKLLFLSLFVKSRIL
jgi:hypothetical protein